MKQKEVPFVMNILKEETKKLPLPIVSAYAVKEGKNPFKVLISTVLSLRTKDAVTAKATDRLFALATTPETMMQLSEETIAHAIYPVGFYKTKARRIPEICKILMEKYQGTVPHDIDVLLTLPGVGRKTANLVLTQGYGKLGICVDTHVHRVSNRLCYVQTKTPEETEFALRKKLPKKYWIIYNDYLVAWGQHVCVPVSPFCSKCKIYKYCERKGVTRSR